MRSVASIAVFTGTRAEYGLLRHLIAALDRESAFALQLIVSGSHLSESHGLTISEILADNIPIAASVPLDLDADPPCSMSHLTAQALAGVSSALETLRPNALIVLGDRYEALAAATAAHLNLIPIIHLHGGETTLGAVDDKLRHAIMQLSTWHFTAAEPYRQRVIAAGHLPSHVFNCGPMVLDALISHSPLSRQDFESTTGFIFGETNLLVTFHPETMLPDHGTAILEALLQTLASESCHILFTQPNADSGSHHLLSRILDFCSSHADRAWFVPSLGHYKYLSALRLFEAIAGNSSSGIIEAPLVGIPVLNIGSRQDGRLRYGPVVEAASDPVLMSEGLHAVLTAGTRTQWPRPVTSSATSSPTDQILQCLRQAFPFGSYAKVDKALV